MPRNNRSRDVAGEGSQAKEKHGLFLLHPPNDTADAEVEYARPFFIFIDCSVNMYRGELICSFYLHL